MWEKKFIHFFIALKKKGRVKFEPVETLKTFMVYRGCNV